MITGDWIDYKGGFGRIEAMRADGLVDIRIVGEGGITVPRGDLRHPFTTVVGDWLTSIYPFVPEGQTPSCDGRISVITNAQMTGCGDVRFNLSLETVTPEQWERVMVAMKEAFALAVQVKEEA